MPIHLDLGGDDAEVLLPGLGGLARK